MTQRPPDDSPDLVAVAAGHLYGLPPGEFTAARTEHARQARASGDRAAATAIGKLGRPTTVAWLANLLVREHADEVAALLELGVTMRAATAALDAAALRQLSRQQQQVIRRLIELARDLAGAAGQGLTDSTARALDSTLHAALADEQAARELSDGRLAAGLSYTGFPGVPSGLAADLAADPAALPADHAAAGPAGHAAAGPADLPGAGASKAEAAGATMASKAGAAGASRASKAEAASRARAASAAEADAARRRRDAERARRVQQQALDDAQEALRVHESAQAALATAEHSARDAAAAVTRLRSELEAAREAQADAGRAEHRARAEATSAEQAARRAERRLADATACLAEF